MMRNFFSRARRRIRLAPPASNPLKGLVAISYVLHPFDRGHLVNRGHTNGGECRAMVDAWLSQGFAVEVTDRLDRSYYPPSHSDAVIDLGFNLARWAPRLDDTCRKIMHATGAHWATQNSAELNRIINLQQRRGFSLQPRRQAPPNLGAECADLLTFVGNDFTSSSYLFAGKPLCRVPISSAYEFDWQTGKDFEASRRRFLWMGSYGMVHKGLDLVLEAFARMPDLELTVCGRPEKEEDFWQAYHRELTSLPNVTFAGWVDLASPEFETFRRTHLAMVYPSCSEGGGGAVIHTMHAGLIPVVTREASVETGDFGEIIRSGTVEEVCAAVRRLSERQPAELEHRAHTSWTHARAHHSLEIFANHYRQFVSDLTDGRIGVN